MSEVSRKTKEKPSTAGVFEVVLEDVAGNRQYCKIGKGGINDLILHREDGPALDYVNGYRAYYKNGLLHRDVGAAVEFAGKPCSYWKHGVRQD